MSQTAEALEGIIVTAEEGQGGLVSIDRPVLTDIFTTPAIIKGLLEMVRTVAVDFTPDLTTDKGRKEIASRAFRVAKTKTYLDDLGKEEVARLKELPKQIDAGRKSLRDGLDLIRDEVRQDLNEWEAEQERIEAEKKALEEAAALTRQIENDHELGLLLNEVHDRKAEDRRRAQEQETREREDLIAQQARETAEAQARKAEQEKEKEEALRNLEAERQASAEREELARQQAAAAERKRQEDEKRKEEAATAARVADIEHRRKFNNEALTDLASGVPGISEAHAKAVLMAIVTGKVRHVSISY